MLYGLSHIKIKSKGYCTLGCAVALVAWLYNAVVYFRMPWGFDIAMTILPMVMLGNVIHEWYVGYCRQKNRIMDVVLLFVATPLTLIGPMFHQNIDMMNAVYPSFLPFLYVLPFGGVLLTTVIAKQIKWRGLEYVGRNSLIIMCVHEPVKRIIIKVCSIAAHTEMEVLRTNFISIVMITLITILATLPIVILINRYMPWVVGRKKKY